MSAYTAESQLSFQLPSLSYIDAKWEEPNLRGPSTAPQGVRKTGLAVWLSRQVTAFITRRRNREAALELAAMSDRELIDIGISRSDLSRVFDPAFSQELSRRGSY
jgi:uncharacterized protein YjiS (DUF1127 family)